jgi:hypothetical protein
MNYGLLQFQYYIHRRARRDVFFINILLRKVPGDVINSIYPGGLLFFHFLASQQKVNRQINSVSFASRAQRAVKLYKPLMRLSAILVSV